MTHCTQVVDFRWAYIGDDGNEVSCITEITIVEEQFDTSLMPVFVNMVDTSCVECRSTTDDSMYL